VLPGVPTSASTCFNCESILLDVSPHTQPELETDIIVAPPRNFKLDGYEEMFPAVWRRLEAQAYIKFLLAICPRPNQSCMLMAKGNVSHILPLTFKVFSDGQFESHFFSIPVHTLIRKGYLFNNIKGIIQCQCIANRRFHCRRFAFMVKAGPSNSSRGTMSSEHCDDKRRIAIQRRKDRINELGTEREVSERDGSPPPFVSI
jgi:hypothetical protein